jgi:hypothetical protein
MATWIFMKSNYKLTGLAPEQIEWVTPPIKFNLYKSFHDIYEEVKECDLILFSSYVWNYELIDSIADYIHQKNPAIKLVLGGPHIGLNDQVFFDSRFKYDYICKPTKPGEVFFNSLMDQRLTTGQWPAPNLVEWEYRSQIGKPYQLPNYSVYRENQDYFTELFQYGFQYQLEPLVIIESTRGCPFECVYCEWGGGTASKIIRKELDIVKEDILALKEAGFRAAFLTDANFGVFEERDIEIYRFAFEHGFALTDISTVKNKNLEKRKNLVDAWFSVVGKKSKLIPRVDKSVKNNANWGIETQFLTSAPTVSLQSISDEAMRVAKRTDLSFKDKLALSEHIRKRCEEGGFPVMPIELILAMPGSTLDDFYNEFSIIWNFKAWNSIRHDYMFLPDTQISDPKYLEKYNIQIVEVYSDLVDEEGVDNQYSLYNGKRTYFKTHFSCFSFTPEEFKEMFFMNSAGNYLLEHIFPGFVQIMTPPEFARMTFKILKTFDGYEDFKSEIDDIFNPNSPPRSIKKLGGKLRTDAIREFLIANRQLLINELFIEVYSHENNRRDSRIEETALR